MRGSAHQWKELVYVLRVVVKCFRVRQTEKDTTVFFTNLNISHCRWGAWPQKKQTALFRATQIPKRDWGHVWFADFNKTTLTIYIFFFFSFHFFFYFLPSFLWISIVSVAIICTNKKKLDLGEKNKQKYIKGKQGGKGRQLTQKSGEDA